MKRSGLFVLFVLLSAGWAGDAPPQPGTDPSFAAHIATTYDVGDAFAASGHRVYVAEDDGGWIEVRSVQDPARPIVGFRTGYDRGDDIAVDGRYLYVAEDDGGRIDVHDLEQGGRLVETFTTSFDRGDALAAALNLVFVVEDDGGWVEVYARGPGGWGAVVGLRFRTSYERGDDVAAANVAFLVAKHDGGLIEVTRARIGENNKIAGWQPKGHFGRTTFDRGDGFGAYVLQGRDRVDLVLCVAEDDGGTVECTTRDYSSWLRF